MNYNERNRKRKQKKRDPFDSLESAKAFSHAVIDNLLESLYKKSQMNYRQRLLRATRGSRQKPRNSSQEFLFTLIILIAQASFVAMMGYLMSLTVF